MTARERLPAVKRLYPVRHWWAHLVGALEFTRLFGAARRAAEAAASFKFRRICREQVESRYSNEATNSSGSHPVGVLLQALFRACNKTPFGNCRMGVFWRIGKHCATYGE
jgi:hypothetical protein